MNAQQSQLDILNKYMNLFASRYKLIVVCLLLAASAAPFFYLNIPRTYQSSASIIYKEQNINPSRLAPEEGLQIREMVNTVTQQVLSRTNLEKTIKDFNLYADLQKTVPLEDIIEKIRKKDIEVSVQRDRGNVFSVFFRGVDPQTVMKVTNELAAKFIEENLRVREERAKATATYIQDELRMSKETLHNKESQMRDYKLQFYNEMPDQRASNMSRLNALQEQFQAIHASIYDREQTRILVSEQLEMRKDIQNQLTGPDVLEHETDVESLWNDLETARNTRQELLSRYTIEHPSVKRIEKQIKQLESKLENLKASDAGYALVRPASSDSRIQELTIQLKWIEAAPIHEAEWSALTRDYDELKRYHDTLLAQSLAAEAASSLERRQKGSQFKVIDPAYLPITPDKGPFRIIFLASIAIGLAAGMGLVLGMDIMDTSFKDKKEIEAFLKLPVTCALPLLVTETEKKRKKTTDILWHCVFTFWLLVLIGSTIYFIHSGLLIL
jgi:protein tyrosine kinase modulator